MIDGRRLAHCTPSAFSDHSPLCDRDGRFCSRLASHAGDDDPCIPHGSPVGKPVGPDCTVGPVGGHSARDWCGTHRIYVDRGTHVA